MLRACSNGRSLFLVSTLQITKSNCRHQDETAMVTELTTHRDALRYVASRVVIAAGLTIVLTGIMIIATVGTDPKVTVSAGFVMTAGLTISFVISVLLTGALSYRSALMMRELNLARSELQRISRTDQLTGLFNRRGFEETALSILAKARTAKTPITALMCDIDRFKAINDQFGHEFGDKVLIEIAQVFRAFAEQNDMLVARHGGEEFAVLIIGATIEQAMKFANELRQACAVTRVSNDGISTYVTISIGLTVSKNASDLSQIMRTADRALYAAKHRGRDRVARADISDSIAA
jgi:diguanylate cyclase (GGDEF)-like protein